MLNLKTIKFATLFVGLLGVSLLTGCSSGEAKQAHAAGKREHTEEVNVVVTSKARQGIFYKEFENNGRLTARQGAVLNFEQSGKIVAVNVSNGDRVEQGDVLAVIEDSQQKYSYEKALRNKEKCYLALEEALLNQGHSINDSASVPSATMKMALIRSGYQDAINEVMLAKQNLDETKVVAPFAGVVAA